MSATKSNPQTNTNTAKHSPPHAHPGPQAAKNPPQQQPNQPFASPVKPPKKNKKILLIGLSGLTFLLFLIIIIYSIYAGRKSEKPETRTNENGEVVDENGNPVEFISESLIKDPTPTPPDNSPTPTGEQLNTTTRIIPGVPELDGFMASDGIGRTDRDILVGRNIDAVTRGFVTFDLSSVPTGITVREALLRLYQKDSIGTPYTLIGEVRIDHLLYGDSLDADDYSTAALLGNITTLSTSKRIGWKEADVTEVVRDDFANGRSQSQFRIHFSKETTGGDQKGDYIYFTPSDNKSQNSPQLVIEYY